ncbi:MAG: GNAT family N-acetyltransferase [Candidatus Heimdallarchaeota archaeon]|nr:GNAT family N-acetyltransferase [Candidatus Heimdallarchaeota archaeon]
MLEAKEGHVEDWTYVFLKGLSSYRWMSRFIKDQNISDVDIEISFIEDVKHKNPNDLLLIAYYNKIPVGIIRLEEYWIPKTMKILSHFPLVVPRYQRSGIGSLLVKEGIERSQKMGFTDIWSECWSKDKREISVYQTFFEKTGFKNESNRLEMNCNLDKFKSKNYPEKQELTKIVTTDLSDEFVETMSKSYAVSKDKLHIIENLGDPIVCRGFLLKIQNIFKMIGLDVKFILSKFKDQNCAAMMIALSKYKGMVLEIGVLPEFRKLKIGQTLIVDFLTELKDKKCKEVILGVDEENTPAVNLYTKLGFQQTWFGSMFLLHNYEKLGLK